MNRIACGKWYRQRDIDDPVSFKRTKFYSKLVSCGKTFETKGKTLRFHCRLAVCPNCSKEHANRQASSFMAQFPLAGNDKFRMVTIGIDTCYEIEEVFYLFRKWREATSKMIHNKRRLKSSQGNAWQYFSMVGSLEVDCFKVSDFALLGQEKQTDFLDNYKFDPKHILQDTLWHITFHGVIHVDNLQEDDIRVLLDRSSCTVHLKLLDVAKSSSDNVRDILGYSNKVRYTTNLDGGKPQEWDYRQVEVYADSLTQLKGRQGHRMMVKIGGEK